MRTNKNGKGFTMIELLVVMAIIGILASVAYPAYTRHVTEAKRAEAKSALLANASALERYYTMNNTYTTSLATAGGKAYSGESSATSAYSISIAAASAGIAAGYTMTATPAISDSVCGNLTLTHTGAKGYSGAGGSVAKCW